MSHIYYIGAPAVKKIKIGYSRDVAERLKKLSAQCPCPLIVLATIEIVTTTKRQIGCWYERALHERYADYRAHAEWFNDCAFIRRDIASFRGGDTSLVRRISASVGARFPEHLAEQAA